MKKSLKLTKPLLCLINNNSKNSSDLTQIIVQNVCNVFVCNSYFLLIIVFSRLHTPTKHHKTALNDIYIGKNKMCRIIEDFKIFLVST